MKRIGCFLLLIALTPFAGTGFAEPATPGAPAGGLTAEEILKKVDDVLTSYKNQTLTSTITVVDSDYYDKSGNEKLKVEERTDFKLYEGKHYNASTLKVTSAKENHKTIMKNSDYEFDQDLPDDYFTTRNLNKPLR
jgi:hypothetical protein